MKPQRFSLPLLLLLGFFCLILSSRSASSSSSSSSSSVLSRDSLGIAPQDAHYFNSGEIIRCKDGSKKFNKSQLNDDFCDCLDGTDEPGTSACPGGKFYCRNSGHAPLSLFSSRVNDGICDCCDGSDEYDGKVKCPNTCWEAGKVARDKLNKKISTYEEGVIIRRKEVEQAKIAISKEEAELSKLKSEEKILKGLVQQLKDQKEQIEKAEEKERLEKEKEEKKNAESKDKQSGLENEATETEDKRDLDSIGASDEASPELDVTQATDDYNDVVDDTGDDTVGNEASQDHEVEKHAVNDKDSMIESENIHDAESKASSSDVVNKEKDGSDSTEGLSKEELGRLVASRWTGENSGEPTEKNNDANEEHKEDTETEDKSPDDYDGYNSEEDNYKDDDAAEPAVDDDFEEEEDDHESDDKYKPDSDDETDYSDITTSSNPSWLEKIQKTVKNILQAVNLFQTPVDKSAAARIRKEYDDASSKLSKIQSRISNLDEKLKQDFGTEKEFYSFYDRCFENKQNKYVYKVCPFKKASQIEGHSTSQLGRWDKFEDSYRTMLFSNGDRCWNGPDRSIKVRLRCGLSNEVTDVDEPSRCEYVAVLSTPALCFEEKLKELKQKLDTMNTEQPQSHDEL